MAQYYTQNAAGYVQNYTGNPYRPPVYSPFQNASHVDDAFGYMANMYGPGLVQGMFGPDAFLAHQSPGQARLDQFTAARYQRHGVAAIEAANMAGNALVSQKIIGGMRAVNGGQPITDLDREHANVGARVINNPIFKQFAASQIGAEALEGVLFGSRGDPAAIAASTNRIGFFRADPAGHGPRMSAASLNQFSQSVYQNLYGPDANLADMHGFGAVAGGEMMETLFQQGRLPQSIGALSAADRVKAVNRTKRDDRTMNALAQQFGHSELLARNAAYASASEEEQKIMLADKLPEFRKRLDSTFSEIDKFSAKDSRAKSAEEIHQLSGFGLAANALDAKNVSRAVKEYNGAVSAIREIFGDNGNPNAPIQQLIANLQHLTNGAQSSMGGGKVEALVREIRLAARDTNTDLQSLNALAAEKKAMARGLGLQEVTAERGLAGDLLRGQAMADAGAFATPGFGKLNRAEAEARASAMSTRGDASSVGRALAAMNRLVSESPDTYRDTPLAAAVEAYRRGASTYTYKGQTYNLAELAGRQNTQGLYALATGSGASDGLFRAYMADQIGTEEYMNAGYTYTAQRYQNQRDFSFQHGATISQRLRGEAANKLKPRTMSDEQFGNLRAGLSDNFAYAMTGVMIDEMADLTPEERIKVFEQRGKEELAKIFMSDSGGGMNQTDADKTAEQFFNMIYGQTPEERRKAILQAYSETDAASQHFTGVALAAQRQNYGTTALDSAALKLEMNKRRAARFQVAGRGTESGWVQRVGDELENLAGSNPQSMTDSMRRIFQITSEDSLLQSYAPDMQEGLVAAARMYTQASVTEKQIDTLADAAQKNPDGSEAKQLKIMAGVDPSKKLTAEELNALRAAAKMQSADTAAGGTDAERAKNQQQRDRADIIMRGFNTGKEDDLLASAKAMARHVLGDGATTDQIEKFAAASLAEDSTEFEKQMTGGFFGIGALSDEQKQTARGIAHGLRISRLIGGLAGAGLEQTPVDVAKAQGRPQARENRAVADLRQSIYSEMDKDHDKKAYEKMRPAGMSDAEFEKYRRTNVDRISLAMASFSVSKANELTGKSPAERAAAIAKGTMDHMTQQLIAAGLAPEDAAAEAKKQFNAVMGPDKEAGEARLNRAFDAAVAARKQHGYDDDTATWAYDGGMSSQNITPEQAEQLNRNGHAPMYGDQQSDGTGFGGLPAAEPGTTHTQSRAAALTEIDNELAAIEKRRVAQGRFYYTAEDDARYRDLTTRKKTLKDNLNIGKNLTVHDPFNMMGRAAGQSLSLREIRGEAEWHLFGGNQDVSERVFMPYNPAYTEEQAAFDVKRYGTKAEQAAFASRGAKKVNITLPDGSVQQVIEKPHINLLAEQSLLDMQAGKDPIGSAYQRLAELEKKKKQGFTGVYFDDEKDLGRYNLLTDTLKEYEAQQSAVAAARGGGGGSGELNVNGTLTLRGLSEAIMQATGHRMEDTPDNGPPVDMGAPTAANYAGMA